MHSIVLLSLQYKVTSVTVWLTVQLSSAWLQNTALATGNVVYHRLFLKICVYLQPMFI